METGMTSAGGEVVAVDIVAELKAQYLKVDAPAWTWDPDFKRILWGNAGAAAFWGEPLAEVLPDKWFDPAGETAMAFSAVVKTSAAIEVITTDIPLTYGGKIVALACEITPFELTDGRCGLFVAPTMPIQAAADAAAAAFDITDILPQGVATFASDGRLLHQNAVALDIFGAFSASAGESSAVALSYWLGGEHVANKFIATVMANESHSALHKVQTRFGQRAYRIHAKHLSQNTSDGPAFVMTFMDAGSQAHSLAAAPEQPPVAVQTAAPIAQPIEKSAVQKTPPVPTSTSLEAMTPQPRVVQEPVHAKTLPQTPDFTWKMDKRTRLIDISAGIAALVDVSPDALLDRTWVSICDQYGFDFDGKIDNLIGLQAPWTETILWPVNNDGVPGAVEIELSAEPVITDSGKFAGYMGTGSTAEPIHQEDSPPSLDVAEELNEAQELTAEEKKAFHDLGNKLNQPQSNVTSQESRDISANTSQIDAADSGHDLIAALEIALDEAPLCYLVHRNFHILYANTAAAKLFGFDASQGLKDDPNLLNLFPKERALLFEWQTKFDDEIAGVGTAARSLTLRGKKADQSDVDIKMAISPIPLDDGYAVQMVLEENNGADEEDLRAAHIRERELRTILDTATDGIATLDDDGRIVTLNKSAEAIFGINQADVEGQKFTNLLVEKSAVTIEDYLNGLTDNSLATIFNDGREVVAIENKGGHIPLFLTIGKMPDDNPTKFCAVMRDITQWKKAEENLKKAIEVAETASSQKSDFLAKISHELRTPLNSIIGFSEVIIQEEFGPLENERYLGYVNDIHSSGNHLLRLINDLLDLSKVEAGKLELDFIAVNLNDIIMKSVNSMQNDASRERIVIRNSLATDLPNVVADERSCTQIILNLLSNAIKFTKVGGQVIVTTSLEESGEVKVSVRDTGIGMSKKDITLALEPFRQITTSSTGSTVGTGLGLPLTKALVEANRARFRIESKPKSGTLVEITFPTARVLAD